MNYGIKKYPYGWSKNAPHGVVIIACATNLNVKNYINIFYDTLTPP